jgi:hypothetical protein
MPTDSGTDSTIISADSSIGDASSTIDSAAPPNAQRQLEGNNRVTRSVGRGAHDNLRGYGGTFARGSVAVCPQKAALCS